MRQIVLLAVIGAAWIAAALIALPQAGNWLCILSPLAVFPCAWIGRLILDRRTRSVVTITTVVHGLILVLYGPAVIKAFGVFATWHGWTIALPTALTDPIYYVTSTLMTLTVLNLALKATGAPFAVALSRKLATSWLYRYTRNPMVLTTILWFIGIGLSLRSAAFIAWALLILTPAELFYLKIYEERELELRFGADYLTYKAKTPFLLPF